GQRGGPGGADRPLAFAEHRIDMGRVDPVSDEALAELNAFRHRSSLLCGSAAVGGAAAFPETVWKRSRYAQSMLRISVHATRLEECTPPRTHRAPTLRVSAATSNCSSCSQATPPPGREATASPSSPDSRDAARRWSHAPCRP